MGRGGVAAERDTYKSSEGEVERLGLDEKQNERERKRRGVK